MPVSPTTASSSSTGLPLMISGSTKPLRLRSACNECHSAKVRCSGERQGCERCENYGLKCEYKFSMVGRKTSKRLNRGSLQIPQHRPLQDPLRPASRRKSAVSASSRTISQSESPTENAIRTMLIPNSREDGNTDAYILREEGPHPFSMTPITGDPDLSFTSLADCITSNHLHETIDISLDAATSSFTDLGLSTPALDYIDSSYFSHLDYANVLTNGSYITEQSYLFQGA